MANERRSQRNTTVACAIGVGQELIRTTLNSLYLENSDDETEDKMIEEGNFVEVQIRFSNPACNKVRKRVYVNEIIPRFNNEVFRQHFRMTRTTYENLERL